MTSAVSLAEGSLGRGTKCGVLEERPHHCITFLREQSSNKVQGDVESAAAQEGDVRTPEGSLQGPAPLPVPDHILGAPGHSWQVGVMMVLGALGVSSGSNWQGWASGLTFLKPW